MRWPYGIPGVWPVNYIGADSVLFHGSSPMPAVRMVYSMSLGYRENRISDKEKKNLREQFFRRRIAGWGDDNLFYRTEQTF